MLRNIRPYRFLRAGVTIVLAAIRYWFLTVRDRWSWTRPSEAAWNRAHRKTGKAIYRLATRLGGGFVKLGQVVGARNDAFPPALVGELSGLHDRVPPRPFDALRDHVETQLGKPIDEVFASVDETPLAAASLAQVHAATLLDGREVVIKIQYPEARRLFPTDLASLRRAARVIRWLNRSLDLRPVANELAEFVTLELDFAREARSTNRARGLFESDPRVEVPDVIEALSTDRLLVLERVDGVPLTDLDAVDAAEIDRSQLAGTVAAMYCAMIFEHGFFHGDPHPGNILARADGTVALLDFGLAKELPDGFSTGVAKMIVNAVAGNGAGALDAAESIGFVVKVRDPDGLIVVLRRLLGDYEGPDRLLDVLKGVGFESVPSHFALIGRVFILLNGLSERLVPGERVIQRTLATALLPHVGAMAASA